MLKKAETEQEQLVQTFGLAAWLYEGSYAHHLVYVRKYPFMADVLKEHGHKMVEIRFDNTALKEFIDNYTNERMNRFTKRLQSFSALHAK